MTIEYVSLLDVYDKQEETHIDVHLIFAHHGVAYMALGTVGSSTSLHALYWVKCHVQQRFLDEYPNELYWLQTEGLRAVQRHMQNEL